jgi:hypothetical protein
MDCISQGVRGRDEATYSFGGIFSTLFVEGLELAGNKEERCSLCERGCELTSLCSERSTFNGGPTWLNSMESNVVKQYNILPCGVGRDELQI